MRVMAISKSKATPAKAATRAAKAPSLYAQTGDDARRKAQRALLLRALREHRWNMLDAAAALGLSGTPGVVRALKDVAPDEYAAAKADGRIRPGVRR